MKIRFGMFFLIAGIFGTAGILVGAATQEQTTGKEAPKENHNESSKESSQEKREPAQAIPEQADSSGHHSKEESEEPQPIAVGISQGEGDSCLPDAGVLSDLKRRQEAVDAKEKELKAKEADLKSRETALNEEMKKLDAVRKQISGIKAAKKQKNEEQVAKLVETLEKMSAKSAAPVLAKVDEDLAVSAMAALSTPQLAKIMAAMDVNRSVRLSELMALGEAAPDHSAGGDGK